ncbi:hypothetical protein, partial [Parazoarcus communis]|uniref:hypothetical protein n=1 Tax=Parazoarcus communis TaxID=41977 RepID=UPI001B7D2188
SSIPGSTTTSTTSGPSGTTTTTRETSYDMDYAPGSVTIKERTQHAQSDEDEIRRHHTPRRSETQM